MGFQSGAKAQTWKKIYTNPQWYGISVAVNPLSQGHTIFYVADSNLNIVRSDDGGVSWKLYNITKKKSTSAAIHQLLCLKADTNIVFALGDGIFRSTDGGKTWTNVLNIASDDGETLVFHEPSNTLYFSPNNMLTIWTSIDHGATWSEAPGTHDSSMVCSIAVSNDAHPTILAGNGMGRIVRSLDGGVTWKEVVTADTGDIETSKILYVRSAPHTAIATSWYADDRTILITTDDGISWNKITSDPKWIWTIEIDPDPVKVLNGIPQHFWIGLLANYDFTKSYPDVSETFDGGMTWMHYNFTNQDHGIWVLTFDSSSHTLFAANGEGLYTLKTGSDVVNSLPSVSSVAYPNPFSGHFNIPLTPEFTAPVELQIWDECGRLQLKKSCDGGTSALTID
ncbi:MAG: WD40/YVTN/BNR-like repeat-containing protein, partial [Candidatus Kapaibacterium sp.]